MDMPVDKKVFVFDWDGTIFDSMSVKSQVFAGAVAEYTAKIRNNVPLEEVMAIYITYSGKPMKFLKLFQNSINYL